MLITIPGKPIAKKRDYNRVVIPGKKYCYACRSYKDFSEFYKNKSKKDGLHTECKQCKAAADKKRKCTESYKKAAREKYLKNKGKYAPQRRRYYLNNREKIIKKQSNIRSERVKWFFGKVGGFCRNCGYNKSTAALQLHHIDDSQKENGHDVLSNWVKWTSLERFIEKIGSLDFTILCANCHIEFHAGLISKRFEPIPTTEEFRENNYSR